MPGSFLSIIVIFAVLLFVTWFSSVIKSTMKQFGFDPYGWDPLEDSSLYREETLKGAMRYDLHFESYEGFIDHFADSILADGYQYVGEIPNPNNAVMEVFVKDLDFKRETVLLIEAEFFTMDMLLEHRDLFSGFMKEHSGLSNQDWEKKLQTVICAREMSAPLQILLSVRGIGYDHPNFKGKLSPQVYAMIEREKKVYVKTFKPAVLMDSVITPWLKKHMIDSEDSEGEQVWQGLDWEDVLYLYWQLEEFQGAQRYDTLYENNQQFIENLTDMLSTDEYEYLGMITNPYYAAIDVYAKEREMKQKTILLIEVDEFTNSLLLEHRYMLAKFMNKHGFEKQWQDGVRIIVCVRKMTPALQILLCTFSAYPKESFYYSKPNSAEVPQVFAVVEHERKTYTMAYTPGSFHDEMMPWMRRYIIGVPGVPEQVWKDIRVEELEGLPMDKKSMGELVR